MGSTSFLVSQPKYRNPVVVSKVKCYLAIKSVYVSPDRLWQFIHPPMFAFTFKIKTKKEAITLQELHMLK